MIPQFQQLTKEERELLIKAPVLVSVLASFSFNQVNGTQKNDAIKLAHLRTFTAPAMLHAYYHEVNKVFKNQFEEAEKHFAPFDDEKRNQIQKEISRINAIIAKLEPGYGAALMKSLEEYARHVKRSVHTVFQDFIFPITYSKMN